MGAMVLKQPRRTLNYGVSYLYSQTYHKLEETTPDDIQTLMDYTTAMYADKGSKDTAVMCLANKYQTGRHYISKHSDKEYQVSHIHDIICWVTGATRRIIIRPKKSSDKVLEVNIPQGIYIMRGDVLRIDIASNVGVFQKNYTHEIPKESEALFTKLTAIVPDDIEGLDAADWLAAHPKTVKRKLPSLYAKYLVWSQERCSYTIRFFDKKHAVKR